jgi:hypothetical protein
VKKFWCQCRMECRYDKPPFSLLCSLNDDDDDMPDKTREFCVERRLKDCDGKAITCCLALLAIRLTARVLKRAGESLFVRRS